MRNEALWRFPSIGHHFYGLNSMDKLYNDIYSPFAHKMYENSVELTDNWFLFGDFF